MHYNSTERGYALRSALTNSQNYSAAANYLSNILLPQPTYFIITGINNS